MSSPVSVRRGTLGVVALFAASMGTIVAQMGMLTLLQGLGIGGWGFIIALFVAFALAMTNAMAYAEMALMMPNAGSLSSYAEAGLGNFAAIMLVFAGYITPAIFGLPVELILMNQIIRDAIPLPIPVLFWPVAMVVIFALLNILGADVFARVQTTLSFAVLSFFLITGITAITGHAAAPMPDAGWQQLGEHTTILGVASLAFWVFVGSEYVTPLVPHAKNPNRDLPRAMIGSLIAIFAAELIFTFGAGVVMPRSKLLASPTPHLEYALAVFGPSMKVGLAVLALLASSSLLNSVLAAVPRMLQGMAENGQVFPVFKGLNSRFGTPILAIVFVASLPLIGLAWSRGDPASILSLTIAASVAYILAYVMAQVSLMALRWRYPKASRPFRMPLFPVLPILAIGGMLFVVSESSPSAELTLSIVRSTGVVLGTFALVGVIWVKFGMKRPLFEPFHRSSKLGVEGVVPGA